MKHAPPHFRPRTALLIGALFVSTPALAQQGQTVTPPQVVPTVPQVEQVTPPPEQVAPPPLVPTVVQPVPSTPEAQPEPQAERQAARSAPAARTARTAPAPRAAQPAAAPAAPAPQPETAPEPAAPVAAPAPAPVEATVPPVESPATPEPVQAGATPIWPWLVAGALAVLAAFAFLMFRRRSEYDEYAEEVSEPAPLAEPVGVEQPVLAEPAAVAAPIVVAERPVPRHEPEVAPRVAARIPDEEVEIEHPVVGAEEATVANADADDLAGIAAGSAPVKQRPWIELGMRPLRAGTLAGEALVEVELIVGNSGDMEAKDVRISTFMIPSGTPTSEMEALLVDKAGETAVDPVSIKPGEGKCIDATLAAPRAEVAAQGESFSPLIVADARYRLPDGTEGRTSASFRIGLSDEDHDGIEPIGLERRGMHDNVAAELEGMPERV